MIPCLQPLSTLPISLTTKPLLGSPSFLENNSKNTCGLVAKDFRCLKRVARRRLGGERTRGFVCNGWLLPVDPWAPTIDSESIASQLFAVSLFPYLGFLYFITKSKSAPKLTLFGFYFLLAFVGATIPAGIYAKVHYGTSLSNVDWLHGGAESLLTLTNIFIVLGLRQALRKTNDTEKKTGNPSPIIKEEKSSSV